jgi:hypothetical protein
MTPAQDAGNHKSQISNSKPKTLWQSADDRMVGLVETMLKLHGRGVGSWIRSSYIVGQLTGEGRARRGRAVVLDFRDNEVYIETVFIPSGCSSVPVVPRPSGRGFVS